MRRALRFILATVIVTLSVHSDTVQGVQCHCNQFYAASCITEPTCDLEGGVCYVILESQTGADPFINQGCDNNILSVLQCQETLVENPGSSVPYRYCCKEELCNTEAVLQQLIDASESSTSAAPPTPTPSVTMPTTNVTEEFQCYCNEFYDVSCIDQSITTCPEGSACYIQKEISTEIGFFINQGCTSQPILVLACQETLVENPGSAVPYRYCCKEPLCNTEAVFQQLIDATNGTLPPAPSPVDVIGPFVAWGAPDLVVGELLHYQLKVTSATGAFVIVDKGKTDFYHLLEREDVPTDLGGMTSVSVQVRAVTMQGLGEFSEEDSIPVTVLAISELIPYLLDPVPRLTFINNSPIVTGFSVEVHFATNYNVSSLMCRLGSNADIDLGEDENFTDCSSGVITYTGLQTATYKFYAKGIVETNGQTISLMRNFRPDNGVECNVHLINNGLTINGTSVMVEYAFIGDYTRCKLDEGEFEDCSSPVVLTDLSPGAHFFKVTPQTCTKDFRHPLKLDFNV